MITHESSLKDFTDQIRFSLDNYHSHGIGSSDLSHVVIAGLGGSGIAGAITRAWAFDKMSIPVDMIGDYHLPKYISDKTLVVLNSYSGNTEETLSMLEDAEASGARILILSSGGKITEIAEKKSYPLYKIESGFQPRMTIGYGLTYLLQILSELMDGEYSLDSTREELEETIRFFEENNDRQEGSAEQIFQFFSSSLKNKFVILADREFYPVAVRFTQQLNENAKLEGFAHVVPESNHNVIESYTDRLPTNFILLYSIMNYRVEARFDFLASHLELENNKVLPMRIPEYNIQTIFDITYRLDWVSVLIANELGAPLMEVPNIMDLKEYLSNIEFVEEGEEESEE